MAARSARLLLCSDLDRTLTIDTECRSHTDQDVVDAADAALKVFNELWASKMSNATLCYSTGRTLEMYEQLRAEQHGLLEPQVLITSDGTEISLRNPVNGVLEADVSWTALLACGWDKTAVLAAFRGSQLITRNCSEEKLAKLLGRDEDFRVSALLRCDEGTAAAAVEELRQRLSSSLNVRIFYCSSGQGEPEFWVVCTPATAGKGHAIEHVRRRLDVPPGCCVVAGDSGNDAPMFDLTKLGYRGIVVANAFPELVHHCRRLPDQPQLCYTRAPYAGALIEGLRFFGELDSRETPAEGFATDAIDCPGV